MSSSGSPSQYRAIGISLAIGSGLLIGSSFVFKKRGLLKSQAGQVAGEGVAYLKSPIWWTGMIMMIAGEICNFGAYAFVEAIVVTPMGALSVVISAILSHYFLKEKLTLFGWIGCFQCILGAILIALNAPQEQSVSTINDFKHLFLGPGFLAYGSVCIVAALVIIFFIAPKYGKKSMLWYILICSVIGGISVSCTSGLGACILTSIRGDNQFKNWFTYFLIFFVACTLLTEIYYLNCALAIFNTAMVTPTYYVLFTFFTLVSSVILYQGLKASVSTILTIAFSFLIICSGIVILQMSKVDPRTLTKVDRRTTLLLQAAREEVGIHHGDGESENGFGDEENLLECTEEPGMDALAGRFSGIGGTIIRARRRKSTMEKSQQRGGELRLRTGRLRMDKANGHRRPGSTSSAPVARVARPSMMSQTSSMSSLHARQLHTMWRDELDRNRDLIKEEEGQVLEENVSSTEGYVPASPSGIGKIDLPPRLDEETLGKMLGEGQILASPMTSPGLLDSRSASVHFYSDSPAPTPRPGSATNKGSGPGRPISTCSNSHGALLILHDGHRGRQPTFPSTGQAPSKSKLRLPNLPKPTFDPSSPRDNDRQGHGSSMLNLNIPSPSLHLPHFLTKAFSRNRVPQAQPPVRDSGHANASEDDPERKQAIEVLEKGNGEDIEIKEKEGVEVNVEESKNSSKYNEGGSPAI